ncbi:MAG: NAD-dependent epimerase/dehydratase family protein, partial [Phycisphaerae bacterium]|nr:NAD-dependent epimerase/dehydratase family protein [Phycisphaerae bacterium]
MRVLVTGGGGFLGTAIVRRLLDGGAEVRTFHRGSYTHLEKMGAQQFRGDLADDRARLEQAADGCELVFHVAARAGVWGPYETYHRPNVIGTRHVLDVCQELGVQRLVYTSSPSVVFDGHDENGIDESAPYPGHYLAHYPHTKALAEQLVLESAGEHFATVALRPHLIWGPGDPHLVPRI